jgi:hypothetical protein
LRVASLFSQCVAREFFQQAQEFALMLQHKQRAIGWVALLVNSSQHVIKSFDKNTSKAVSASHCLPNSCTAVCLDTASEQHASSDHRCKNDS